MNALRKRGGRERERDRETEIDVIMIMIMIVNGDFETLETERM